MHAEGPAQLLELAQESEAGLRLTERTAALDRLEELLDGQVVVAPGRNWRAELNAERAVDAARLVRTDEAFALADAVLDDPDAGDVARARATEARGRALGWLGTEGATRRAEQTLLAAADQYQALNRTEWQGYALFCLGAGVHLQNGELVAAGSAMEHALAVLGPDSPRRPMVLDFLADVLIALGDWHRAERVLDEVERLAYTAGDQTASSYSTWSRARMASARGDAMATRRYLREVEDEAADWFDEHTATTFLAEAAEMLDRVGNREQAQAYLARATGRNAGDPFVAQARAALLARAGDPHEAVAALADLGRSNRIEKRLLWRHSLLLAWATFRTGDPTEAGVIAARALEQAVGNGGIAVAASNEPELVAALAPLAEAEGSADARVLLAGASGVLVRVFGTPRVTRGDGTQLTVPPGQPAELLRLVAMHPFGVGVERVLDELFPDVGVAAARHRLRQVLTRLRSAIGEVVVRTADRLVLVPGWVDAVAFEAAADRARAARGPRAAQFAYAALAIWSGQPLPTDVYSEWANAASDRLRHRYLYLLDVVAEDAARRNSHSEALAALTAALDETPDDPDRNRAAGDQLRALDHHHAAAHFEQRAANGLGEDAD